jgi:urease accessory protein
MVTVMPATELLRLMTLLSPAFPTGAFSYSHGLEWAVHDGLVRDRAGLIHWLADVLERGSLWNDAVLLAAAWRGDAVEDLAEAMAGTAERHLEAMQLGTAFIAASQAWAPGYHRATYSVAVGKTASRLAIPLQLTLTAYISAFVTNLVSATQRLAPIGQSEAVAILHAFEGPILATAARAAASTLGDLGSATIMSEIASMRHETQHSRIFRS